MTGMYYRLSAECARVCTKPGHEFGPGGGREVVSTTGVDDEGFVDYEEGTLGGKGTRGPYEFWKMVLADGGDPAEDDHGYDELLCRCDQHVLIEIKDPKPKERRRKP